MMFVIKSEHGRFMGIFEGDTSSEAFAAYVRSCGYASVTEAESEIGDAGDYWITEMPDLPVLARMSEAQRAAFSDRFSLLLGCAGGGLHSDVTMTAVGEGARTRAEELQALGLLGACAVSEPDFAFSEDALRDDDDALSAGAQAALRERGRWTYPLTDLGAQVYEMLTGEPARRVG